MSIVGKEVYILLYSHQHGIDFCPYETEKKAYDARNFLVQMYRSDFDIPDDISHEDAANDWFQLTNGKESFEIEKRLIE